MQSGANAWPYIQQCHKAFGSKLQRSVCVFSTQRASQWQPQQQPTCTAEELQGNTRAQPTYLSPHGCSMCVCVYAERGGGKKKERGKETFTCCWHAACVSVCACAIVRVCVCVCGCCHCCVCVCVCVCRCVCVHMVS